MTFITYLHGINHFQRTIFVMLAAVLVYCLWLWALMAAGALDNKISGPMAAAVFLLPLVPLAVIDLVMRLSWRPDRVRVHPPLPSMTDRLLHRDYGLYWWPGLICIPLWLWAIGVFGFIGWAWLFL